MKVIIGPDVSFYDDDPATLQGIDFVRMRQQANFVIVRAGQGLFQDSTFANNWSHAKQAGLPRGSYWLYDSRADPKQQAELWAQLLGGDPGELPLFADMEENYGGPFKGWANWVVFLDHLKSLVGNKEIGIYTAFFYWKANAPDPQSQPADLQYFHQYPLWIANYGVTSPSVPQPWDANEWMFWQFTETGDSKTYGAESQAIDLSFFNGDGNAFTQRFNLSTPEVPHDYPPPLPPGTNYQVTTTALNVRSGPGTNNAVVGVLKNGEIVQGLGANPDGSWIQIRRADGLTGWCASQYLSKVETPPPPPPPSGVNYRVTTSLLNIRSGPGTSFSVIGSLKNGDIVEGLGTNPDGSWTRIRRTDGLTGWCASQYLTKVETSPPTTGGDWYRVTATTLYVRSGAGTSFGVVGSLQMNDVVVSTSVTADGSWVQIQRADGLTGWCSFKYLVNLGKATPAAVVQKLSSGVTYYRNERQQPRDMVSHTLIIDLHLAGLRFLVTPPDRQSAPWLCSRKTSQFLTQFRLQVAVNGDGFSYADANPQQLCPNGGDPVNPNGYAASRGTVYSQKSPGQPIIYINQNNEITFDQPKGSVYNALSADRLLVSKGQAVNGLDSVKLDPRTAFGVNSNGRSLILVVVDGRETSAGATFTELAGLLISAGAYTGVSLDGGGSSTMVVQGVDGNPRVLNTPIDDNIPGQERAVANHLGIYTSK